LFRFSFQFGNAIIRLKVFINGIFQVIFLLAETFCFELLISTLNSQRAFKELEKQGINTNNAGIHLF